MALHMKINGWEKLRQHKIRRFNGASSSTFKLPVLGARGSGAKELGKSLRTLYGDYAEKHQFGIESESDAVPYKQLVRGIAIDTMLSLVNEVKESGVVYSNPERVTDVTTVKTQKPGKDIPRAVWLAFKRLWNDPIFGEAAMSKPCHDKYEDAEYYFNSIDRLRSAKYIPSSDDIKLCRFKLNGVSETPMRKNLWLLEVEPIETKKQAEKILQFFGSNTVVIYCVDISSYDQFEDDGKTNKLLKTLEHFQYVANHDVTKTVYMLTIFTNKEEFETKLARVPLKTCFRHYKGSNSVEEAMAFIRKKFQVQSLKRRGYCSFFIAGDRLRTHEDVENMKKVLLFCASYLQAVAYKLV
uniref:guanine nucleotide-binding protein G(o) subunit alpha-like n=1 Tax=Styela clava TaxID=7725 RepID=UPI00193A4AC2|nr:guanine nucleotide-binding protein G(o) subunit alpha-like [Styela clava]